jgi:hypothetical protein
MNNTKGPMEFLLRIPCPCRLSTVANCQCCDGKQYVDRWLPFELLRQFKNGVIVGRRFVDTLSSR